MKTRVYALEGVNNFRDFGAYEGAGGRQIRANTLYRSAQFGEATDTDIQQLEALNIRVQADLRRPDERERHGHRWPGKAVTVIKSDKGRAAEAPHVRFMSEVAVGAAEAEGWMVEYYKNAPYRESLVDSYRIWFETLATLGENSAAVVNCAAGKDRTGILCALTHHALGVDREAVFADYVLTNQAGRVEERLPKMAEQFNAHIGKSYDHDVYRPFIGVRAKYLEAAFASIAEQSGSLEAYLKTTLGVGEKETAALRARLLA